MEASWKHHWEGGGASIMGKGRHVEASKKGWGGIKGRKYGARGIIGRKKGIKGEGRHVEVSRRG